MHADQQALATFRAAGADITEIPSVDQAFADFDAALRADPVELSPQLRLLQDLGVA